ncbi:MAG: flagellar type III secretion system pore protein FliP [Alphaproteobacteria bacterium]|nr:flagellar type III secretion system pore protein FliP [Alphaproteobacteria bacterium]
MFKKPAVFLAMMFVALNSAAALAQTVSIDLGGAGTASASARIIQMILLITVLSIAPSILIMTTSFTRIVVVLSIARNAIGMQTTPPTAVLVSLALFLTGFIMAPTFQRSYNEGLAPMMAERVTTQRGVELAIAPLHQFMLANVRDKDLELFMNMRRDADAITAPEEVPLSALVPAFMISELRRAFEIGFLLFLPFMIIDMLVASILLSMGMMMLPPSMMALPFKIIFFVLIDGWYLLAGSLMQSFVR